MIEWLVTKEFLENNPDCIFVFGDNLERRGLGGAAKLRNLSNTYGFITKKAPNNLPESFYIPEEYNDFFWKEVRKLATYIYERPKKLFIISKLGAGLANRYLIFQKIIEPNLKGVFSTQKNILFTW